MKKCIMLATLLGGMVSLPVSADYRNAATDPSVNAVAVKVTIKGPPHVPLNRLAVTVLGEVRGARQAQVVLQRRDGAWRSIKRKKVGRRGRYVFRVLHLTHGEQVYRVLVKTDGQLLARSKNHHTHVHDFVLPVGPPPPPPPPPGDVPPPPPTLPEDVPPTPPPVLPDHPHHSERAELGARSHSPGASYGPWQCLNLVSTQFHQMPTSVGSAFAEQVVYWVTYYWFWNGFERQFYGNGGVYYAQADLTGRTADWYVYPSGVPVRLEEMAIGPGYWIAAENRIINFNINDAVPQGYSHSERGPWCLTE